MGGNRLPGMITVAQMHKQALARLLEHSTTEAADETTSHPSDVSTQALLAILSVLAILLGAAAAFHIIADDLTEREFEPRTVMESTPMLCCNSTLTERGVFHERQRIHGS